MLAADETPVNVVDTTSLPGPEPGDAGEADPAEKAGKKAAAGAPHVLTVTTPDARLRLMLALASRRKGSAGAGIPAAFTGHLMTDGCTGCQHLLSRLAGIQQCCQHIIRRCRAVSKLGPGGVQNWAEDIITVLRDAHAAVEDARARGSTELASQVLDDLRERYGTAAESGRIHNRLRAWDTGNHPGYALACWLADYKEQVFLFHPRLRRGLDEQRQRPRRQGRQAPPGRLGLPAALATLARWCRIRSYLDSAAAHGTAAHGTTALDAVRAVIKGKPWLPPVPAIS